MSEQKHTPGPWISSYRGFQVLTGDERRTICELKGKIERDEQVANARLIAAAPDLLAACELAYSGFGFPIDDESHNRITNALANAIAKAKGHP